MHTYQELIARLNAILNNTVNHYQSQYSRSPSTEIKNNFETALANELTTIIQQSIKEGVDNQEIFLKEAIQTVINSFKSFQ